MNKPTLTPFRLLPTIKNYIWGGRNLVMFATPEQVADQSVPIAEAWVVYEDNRVADGAFAGQTLAQLSESLGEALLGQKGDLQNNRRFQLLVKILDSAKWLSVQVHPDNELARQLEGAGFNGKTEAWYILDAYGDAQLLAGVKKGVNLERLQEAIRSGNILDVVEKYDLQKDDLIMIDAGTVHALGPGELVYEVQQTSDLTYRVYDWGRPETAERPLHIEKSVAAARPVVVTPQYISQDVESTAQRCLVDCPYFHLERLTCRQDNMNLATRGLSFHALTVIEGSAEIIHRDYQQRLGLFDSVIVPADCGEYCLKGDFRALKASIE